MSIPAFEAAKVRSAFDPEKAIAALNELQPRGRKRVPEEFSSIYWALESAISRGVAVAEILAALKKQGLIISVARLKKLRTAEEKRYGTDSRQAESDRLRAASSDAPSEPNVRLDSAASEKSE